MPTLIELLRHNNIPLKQQGEHHHAGKGWVQIDCPKCSPGWGKFRLGFHPATGRSFCWVCGPVDGVAILSEVCNVSLRDSADTLRQPFRGERADNRPHTGKLQLPTAGELLPAHRAYLKGRGFDPDEIARVWGVGGIGPLGGTLAWRLLIPIKDPAGKTVSWTTRSIKKDAEIRYLSAAPEQEAVPHKELLYGAHLAKHAVVIVEGPISAWSIGPGAVATCGLGYSQQQMGAMLDYPVRAVCFDAEPAAQKRAAELCRELSAFPGRTENIELETGSDPAEIDPAEVAEIRAAFL